MALILSRPRLISAFPRGGRSALAGHAPEPRRAGPCVQEALVFRRGVRSFESPGSLEPRIAPNDFPVGRNITGHRAGLPRGIRLDLRVVREDTRLPRLLFSSSGTSRATPTSRRARESYR